MQCTLTIAGSDSSGGAGIQADLKTFAAHGVYGLSAITAITAQNTVAVNDVIATPAAVVTAQIRAIVTDFAVNASKIGMLATAENVAAVADAIVEFGLSNVVLDPVMRSSSGRPLLDAPGVALLRSRLLPVISVVTPNLDEAETLTGIRVDTLEAAARAASALATLGARSVVITGGHMPGEPVDLVWIDGVSTMVSGERVDSRHTHGTGCTFSAALAARLARGDALLDAVRGAKRYVADAIARAPGLGRGRGPLGHL